MKINIRLLYVSVWMPGLLLLLATAKAQSDVDAIMMNKKQWCNGIRYEHSRWTNYWEGTLRRSNENLGTFTSQSATVVSNYGISDKLNVMAGLPYVDNKVSAGTLHRMRGLQDASLAVKWMPVRVRFSHSKLSLFAVGSLRMPTHQYGVDFLPLSIGLGSTNITARAMADYQSGKFFTTASASYTLRSHTKLDRSAYYTDHMVYSNKVDMPNTTSFLLSAGLRSRYLIAEAVISRFTTLGGFDIRRNDMPFASNRMNATSIGTHVKYTLPAYTHLEFTADGNRVMRGRNTGQATSFAFGVYYLFTFGKKTTQPATHS